MGKKNGRGQVFEIPGREFGPAPWLAWMDGMSRGAIDRDLKRLLRMEVYEVIPIALYGLKPEYMGEEYMALFRHACRRCREWGMKLWIYDEFNWPSGVCAGRVLREFPDFRAKNLLFRRGKPGGSSGRAWEIVETRAVSLAAYGAEWASEEPGNLDTLNPAAVRAYIDMTHEVYKREAGEYFGDVILGFFTDEPHLPARQSYEGPRLPYTPGLFEMFRERFGYDLRPKIRELAEELPGSLRTRSDYWKLVAELFRDAYFRQYASWCEDNGLRMTGHLEREEFLWSSADLPMMLSEMHVPGIDILFGAASFDGMKETGWFIPGPAYIRRDITGKLVESAAYFAGRDRTLSESFGCLPNTSTLVDYKRAADFLFHNGISLVNDNLFSSSLSSFRKFCGCHAFLTPWVKHYGIFSRYVRMMSWLNSGSRLETSVGLYYPGADLRARYAQPTPQLMGPYGYGPNDTAAETKGPFHTPDWERTQTAVFELSHGLLRRHWDYYLVFDHVLRDSEPCPGGMRIRDFRPRALVFPETHYVDAETGAVLRKFVKSGGTMICVGRVPMELDGKGSAKAVRWGPAERVVKVRAGRDEIAAEVAKELGARLPRPVKISGPGASDVMATRRKTAAGSIVFLTNFGRRAADIAVRAPGEWRRVGDGGEPGGGMRASERLLPGESRLFIRRKAEDVPGPAGEASEMGDDWDFRLPGGNVISLPMALFRGRGAGMPAGSARGAWAWCNAEEAEMDLKPGKTYWLRREIEVNYIPRRLEFIVDGCDGCEVYVNRRKIRSVPCGEPVWDDENRCCDLKRAVRRGKNEILVKYTPAAIRKFVTRLVPLNDLPPFIVRGDFSVPSRVDHPGGTPILEKLPGKVTTGALQGRGCPNFAGTAEYAQTVRLDEKPEGAVLDMGRQNDLFEIEINGRPAGVLGWPPYRLEIGEFLKRGDNRFVFRLHTSLGGVLSRFYRRYEIHKKPVGLLETPALLLAAPGHKKGS